VWSFLVGGNILGLLAAGIGYPLFRIIFGRFIAAKRDKEIQVIPAQREHEAVVVDPAGQVEIQQPKRQKQDAGLL
jgi:hypothetical protein